MTLTQTLRLQERYLKYDDLRALDYCEKRWQEENRPLKRWELINFIEKMLRELQSEGIGYPKVLLLRKKEIQRREFTISEPSAPEPDSGDKPDVCDACFGSGWINAASGARPCTCEAGRPHRKQLAKWGMKV
jgi:hypothetical protein